MMTKDNDPTDPGADNSTAGAHAPATAGGSLTFTPLELQQVIQSAVQALTASTRDDQRNNPPTTTCPHANNAKRPDRPSIGLDCNQTIWAFFLERWELYKRVAALPPDAADELRLCCTEDLHLAIFEHDSTSVRNLSETALMDLIRQLAVENKNIAIHRHEFYRMTQNETQTAQQFASKLKAKATHCNFEKICPCGCNHRVSYSREMVADVLTVGCHDKDIQSELFIKSGTVRTLEEKLELMKAMEGGTKARAELGGESSVSAQRSTYRRQRDNVPAAEKPAPQNTFSQRAPRRQYRCQGCGSPDHGPHTDKPRSEHCPARDATCSHCQLAGHLDSVCRRKRRSPQQTPSQKQGTGQTSNNAALHTSGQEASWLCAVTSDVLNFTAACHRNNRQRWANDGRPASSIHRRVMVPHMEWDSRDMAFRQAKPRSMPLMSVSITPLPHAHASFGSTLAAAPQTATLHAIADTGAQTCAAGADLLDALGLSLGDLVPTSHRIKGVTKTYLDIHGVLLARITMGSSHTNQVVYICKNAQSLYLSQKALLDLGAVPQSFPTRDTSEMCPAASGSEECSCPLRTSTPPRPSSIPFAPTEENVGKLEKWLKTYYGSSAFNTCEHRPLPSMHVEPLRINMVPDAVPHAVHRPIPVPHHWKDKVKADLDRDVQLGIIEPVPPGTPTIWCSRMVVVAKKDGSPRRTVDLQKLNAATYRATHHTASPFNLASSVPGNTRKTVLDAWNAYHLIPLDPAAKDATTFITEWGRYRYCRGPQGFKASGDAFTKSYYDLTIDVPRKAQCVDDSILWDRNIEESFWHTVDYIQLCASKGVVFNPDKFQFARKELEFAGFNLSMDGLKPSKKLIDAIQSFPVPKNITDARSWFGLVNQVSFSLSTSATMLPFRELLKPGEWYWDDTLDQAFAKSKSAILSSIEQGVRTFEPRRPTCISTDWSKTGLGFILSQKHCRCDMKSAPRCCREGWRLVFAGSRFTTPAESRYAPVEGEALAVAYALSKCRMFIMGCEDLLVTTDHKPLVKILGDSDLDRITNPRIFAIKERTLEYKYSIRHVPGAKNSAPDACSRRSGSPSQLCIVAAEPSDNQHNDSLSATAGALAYNHLHSTMHALESTSTAITEERLTTAAMADADYQELLHLCTNGFPTNAANMPNTLRPFHKLQHQLHATHGLIFLGNRVVVPQKLRREVLEGLHAAHQGVSGMKARAATCVFWPGISADIASRRAHCQVCNTIAPSQPPQPLRPASPPTYPFELVAADYFSLGNATYLVYADRYTGWVTISKSPATGSTAESLIRDLRIAFGAYGVPRELASDGGPQFAARPTQDFLKTWGVTWRVSSAYFPQSNGRAELAVKTAKRLLRDHVSQNGDLNTDAVARALLQYRNTPLPGINRSPAQLLYGRQLRDHLPAAPGTRQVRPEWLAVAEDRERALAHRHLLQIEWHNNRSRPLPPLRIGCRVQVQNQHGPRPNRWEKSGTITEIGDHDNYTVVMDGSGRCTLRNRRFLKEIVPFTDTFKRNPNTTPSVALTTGQPSAALTSPTAPAAATTAAAPAASCLPHQDPAVEDNGQNNPGSSRAVYPMTAPSPPPRSIGRATALPCAAPSNPGPHLVPQQRSTPSAPVATPPRRSARQRRAPRALSPSMRGQSHNVTCRNGLNVQEHQASPREGDM